MLERRIWGIDALSYAVQIASINLALQDPTTPVRSMNMFAVPLGLREDRVTLGSLEFVVTRGLQSIAMYLSQTPPRFLEEAEAASITGGEIPTILPEFDVIIMNPPFTRATGRRGKKGGGLFGFIPDESVRHRVLGKYNSLRKEVRRYLLQLHEQDQYRVLTTRIRELLNIGPAGEGLLFLYLAYRQIKDGGRIAFVLPKSLLSGISWYLARNLLLQKFHLEHIVVSYDAQNGYNFSESTSLSEVLIVAKRREPPKEDEPTTITLLLTKPKTALEARALAFKILRTGSDYLEVNGARAYVYRVPRKRLVERALNWGTLVAFPEPRLTQIANSILDGKIFNKEVPMVRLSEIATIGIDRHQFHDAFSVVSGRPPGSYPAVYGGEEEVRKRMLVEPNARIMPKETGTGKGERLFNGFSSKLLVPDRIWIDTTHVTAIYSTEPVLSNIFYALKIGDNGDEERTKALCLWLNTTWGILSILANRTETRGRWINLKMTHWRLQPVLDVTRLKGSKIENLATIFDKYCRKELRRLPEQFNPNNTDPTREGLDKEFLEALDVKVDEKELNELYRLVHQNLTTWVGEETGVVGEEDEE
jgi:hypothetical protein